LSPGSNGSDFQSFTQSIDGGEGSEGFDRWRFTGSWLKNHRAAGRVFGESRAGGAKNLRTLAELMDPITSVPTPTAQAHAWPVSHGLDRAVGAISVSERNSLLR
jgi:hypothetical protein